MRFLIPDNILLDAEGNAHLSGVLLNDTFQRILSHFTQTSTLPFILRIDVYLQASQVRWRTWLQKFSISGAILALSIGGLWVCARMSSYMVAGHFGVGAMET